MTRRQEMDNRIRPVRELLDELAPQLSAPTFQSADELLRNDEPNEALIQISWDIATQRIEVPARILTFIEMTVGDPQDLPIDLTGRSGPPVRRPAFQGTTGRPEHHWQTRNDT